MRIRKCSNCHTEISENCNGYRSDLIFCSTKCHDEFMDRDSKMRKKLNWNKLTPIAAVNVLKLAPIGADANSANDIGTSEKPITVVENSVLGRKSRASVCGVIPQGANTDDAGAGSEKFASILRQIDEAPKEPLMKCKYCGCTDDHACEGGCSWVTKDVCSKCAASFPIAISPCPRNTRTAPKKVRKRGPKKVRTNEDELKIMAQGRAFGTTKCEMK